MGRVMHAHANRKGRPEPEIKAWAREAFAGHVMRPEEVRSFTFRTPGKSAYWFGLTWRPGHLSLVGDVGEMTLTHYQALATFEDGIRWAASGSYSYLMEKSDKQGRELDREATVEHLIRSASEDAAWALTQVIAGRRTWRRDYARGCHQFERALAEWDFWRGLGLAGEEDRPSLVDFTPEHYRDEEGDSLRFALVPKVHWKRNEYGPDAGDYVPESKWDIPAGWEAWFRLWWRGTGQYGCSGDDPNIILSKVGRRQVYDDLAEEINSSATTPDDIADLCRECGFSDYYGSYKYKPQTLWQIEAIKHGCNLILDQIEPSRTWGRSWGDPVV